MASSSQAIVTSEEQPVSQLRAYRSQWRDTNGYLEGQYQYTDLADGHLKRPTNRVSLPLSSRFYKDRLTPDHHAEVEREREEGSRAWNARKRELALANDENPHNPAMFRQLSTSDHFDPCLTLARHEFCCAPDGEVPPMHGRPFDEPLFTAARNLPVHGIDNKPSAPGPRGAVFGHCVFETACSKNQQPQQPQQGAGELAELEKQLQLAKQDQKLLESELAQLKEGAKKPVLGALGLPREFEFGEKVYQCLIPAPGVGYRNTPVFADKNQDGTGPQEPQVVIADCICQGPGAVFVRDARNGLWLPLTSPGGVKKCFHIVGNKKDVDLTKFQLCEGKVKTAKPQGAWFASSGTKQG